MTAPDRGAHTKSPLLRWGRPHIMLSIRAGGLLGVESGLSSRHIATTGLRRSGTFPSSPRNGALRPKPSRLLRLTEAALSVSAGDSSKQETRWREAGRDRQVEAVS